MNIRQLAWDRDQVEALGPSVQVNPWGATASETLGGSQLWEVDEGPLHVLIATKGLIRDGVATMEVTGMVSTGARMQTDQAGRMLDTLGNLYRADYLAFFTPHPHLWRGAERLGFDLSGRLYRKRVSTYGKQ